ncbi:MAG: CHAT domain-containing protein [Algibacter sp.]|uniref:CHAT domain-containing protein n=1 Tax=Algibacter sp. TaxID=1872428 RepID=UPI00329A6BFB
MNKICFLLFLFYGFGIAQNLEETIYVAAETFLANQNDESLQILNRKESVFKTQVKTKDEQLALVFLQSHKAYYLDKNSHLKEAITTYEIALKRFNKHELSKISEFDIIENCLKPLGNLYTKTDDFTNALITINQYIFLAKKNKNTSHQISGGINLAKLYLSVGKHETALKIIEDTYKIPNISNTQKTYLQNIKSECLIVLNKLEKGTYSSNLSNSSPLNIEKNNYLIQLQNGNYQEAFKSFKTYKNNQLKSQITERMLSQLHIEEAQLYFLLNNKVEALKSLQVAIKILLPNYNNEGLPPKNQLYAENKFIDIFDLYAEIITRPETALQSYNLSFYVSSLLRNAWTSQETKILNETNNRIRSEKCIDILYYLYTQTKNKTLLFEAFQYAENNKSSVLKDIFLKKIQLQRYPIDSLLIKEFSLIKEQEYITGQLVKENLSASKINELSIKLSSISHDLKSLKPIILKKYPEELGSFSLKTLQDKLLKDNTVLTEYFYGRYSIFQFIISNNDITLNRIPNTKTIQNEIKSFIHLFDDASIINNNITNYTEQAFKIYKLLKFDALSTFKNVLIIPDGLLNFLPFEALLKEETHTSSFSKMPFVVNAQSIAYNTNVLFYLYANKKHKNNNVLGFFPVFENTNQELTYSINEAETIDDNMTSDILMGTEATKTNFNKKAAGYGILHLSTHASSGNLSKPANISFIDETLYLNELYNLNLNSNLVVLSACETGVGTLFKGEGAMSIARGFQYAGAQNLLFSLWQINDLSTSQIMESFYKNYKLNASGFTANHHSKIKYLQNKSISNIKKSPYFWSAFVYYGSPKVSKSQNFTFYIIIGILIVFIVLFLFFKLKNNGRKTARIST